MFIKVFVLLAAALIAATTGAAEPAAPPLTAVHCGHLIDTEADRLLAATTVVVAGNRIQAVPAGVQTPAGARCSPASLRCATWPTCRTRRSRCAMRSTRT